MDNKIYLQYQIELDGNLELDLINYRISEYLGSLEVLKSAKYEIVGWSMKPLIREDKTEGWLAVITVISDKVMGYRVVDGVLVTETSLNFAPINENLEN